MRRVLAACLLLPIVSHTTAAQTSAGGATPPTASPAPTHHEPDPCEINVLLPTNVLIEFPVDTPRSVAVQAMVAQLGVDKITAGGAFDRAVEDQKRSCAQTWRGWLRSW